MSFIKLPKLEMNAVDKIGSITYRRQSILYQNQRRNLNILDIKFVKTVKSK